MLLEDDGATGDLEQPGMSQAQACLMVMQTFMQHGPSSKRMQCLSLSFP